MLKNDFEWQIVKSDDRKIDIDWEDEIIKSAIITHNGKILLDQFK